MVTVQCFVYIIIPYQEIIGNYSTETGKVIQRIIIPYQEIIGNYSCKTLLPIKPYIIPYQEIIGNYSEVIVEHSKYRLYHTKK